MRRLHILLITNLECETEIAQHLLKAMGHDLDEVYDAIWAIEKISHKTFDAIIVAEFSVEEAELIVCDIRMQTQQNMYSIILNKEAQHKEHNDYADEVIPLTRPALRDALARKFSGV